MLIIELKVIKLLLMIMAMKKQYMNHIKQYTMLEVKNII